MLCHVQFHSLFNFTQKVTPEIVVEFEKHPLHTPPLEGGDSVYSPSSFLKSFLGDLDFDAFIIGLS